MSAPSYISEPQIRFLSQLLDEMADGHLLVPRFQRGIRWTDEQRLRLLESVASNTPIGSIYLWRTRRKDVQTFDRLGPFEVTRASKSGDFSSYILDGHQRLATLFGALNPTDDIGKASEDPGGICWEILYDLRDEEFVLANDTRQDHLYLKLRKALDSVERLRFQRELFDQPDGEALVQLIERLTAAIQGYKVVTIPIVSDDLDEVTRIFHLINSQGTPIDRTDMIHALTWSRSFQLHDRIDGLLEQRLGPLGWKEIESSLVLTTCQAALGLDVYEKDVDLVSRQIRQRPEIVDEAAENLAAAVEFLGEHCEIRSPNVLPYGPLLPLLAESLRRIERRSPELDRALVRWFWWTVYVEFAGGSNASRVRRAARRVVKLVEGGDPDELLPPAAGGLAPLPKRFDFRHARAKALALRMAEKIDLHCPSRRAIDELNRDGAGAIHSLVTLAKAPHKDEADRDQLSILREGPANRIIARAADTPELRGRLLGSQASLWDSDDLHRAYLIPERRLFPEESWLPLLERRFRLLEDLERTFAENLGLVKSRDGA